MAGRRLIVSQAERMRGAAQQRRLILADPRRLRAATAAVVAAANVSDPQLAVASVSAAVMRASAASPACRPSTAAAGHYLMPSRLAQWVSAGPWHAAKVCGSEGQSWRRNQSSHWGFGAAVPHAAAACLAAAAVTASSASCPQGVAACERQSPTSDKQDADLRDAMQKVETLWRELEYDIHRKDALLPCGRAAPHAQCTKPRLRQLGDRLSIGFPLRRGADLTSVFLECTMAIGGDPGELAVRQGNVAVQAVQSGAACVLRLQPADTEEEGDQAISSGPGCRLHAQIFIPLFGTGREPNPPEVELFKTGQLSDEDLEVLHNILLAANTISCAPPPAILSEQPQPGPGADFSGSQRFPDRHEPSETSEDFGSPEANRAAERLRSMGAQVYQAGNKDHDWEGLAGYEAQKLMIEDTLLLALQRPEVYERIARRTRARFATNRPRAVLFEGPPGTGKTTSGRIIAAQASIPMVYIPLESMMSKYYGESEKLLSEMFSASEALGGCIVFLDEVDSLATTRGGNMHEATRRILGVLLRQMDGFDSTKRSVVIAATNRKEDLDPALLSRFDATVLFDLPDTATRAKVIRQYAKHLGEEELSSLADFTQGMSGRDLRDICEQTERKWASRILRAEVDEDGLPGEDDYLEMCAHRRAAATKQQPSAPS